MQKSSKKSKNLGKKVKILKKKSKSPLMKDKSSKKSKSTGKK